MPKPSEPRRPRNEREIDPGRAGEVGLLALVFLTADAGRLERFLALTGATIDQLKSGAGTGRLHAAILEYLSRDESLMLEFAGNAGVSPASVERARAILADQP